MNGRPTAITLPTGGTVGYRYDAVGNRTATILPDGTTITTTYTLANQPASMRAWDGSTTTFDYDANGRLQTVTRPNGTSTTTGYDAAGRVTRLTHARGATVLDQLQYQYDAAGRRVGMIDATRTLTYTFDGLDRLIQATSSDGTPYQYRYDAAGNRLTAIEGSHSTTATYNAANQLTSLNGVTTTSDANGNLLSDGTSSYQYDSLDRLIAATAGITTTTMGYTAMGDRLWQATAGITTTYTLDLNTALAQVLAQTMNGTTTSILPGLGQQTNGAWQYWHADAQGSVQAVSDGTGQIIGTQRSTPFGRSEAQTGALAAMGYTGEPQDSLVYLRARYYHPALGRFLTQDSIVPDVLNGQDWNGYAYVRNNPMQWVDPRGHAPDGFEPHDSTGGWLGDVAHWAGEKAQQVGDWWNKKDCTCTPPQSSDWATAFSAAGTVGFGFGTEPVRTHATVTIEQFNRQHPTQPPDISKRSIPYNKLSDKGIHYDNNLYVNGDGAYISAADPNTGKRYTFGRERVLNPKGFAAGILGGMAVDAMLQGLQDWNRCLTGADRIHNMLVAALAAGAVGLVGAAVFGAVLLVLPTATLTATVASITVSVIASNIGPIADLKNRALR